MEGLLKWSIDWRDRVFVEGPAGGPDPGGQLRRLVNGEVIGGGN